MSENTPKKICVQNYQLKKKLEESLRNVSRRQPWKRTTLFQENRVSSDPIFLYFQGFAMFPIFV